jgi:hypothetical protein
VPAPEVTVEPSGPGVAGDVGPPRRARLACTSASATGARAARADVAPSSAARLCAASPPWRARWASTSGSSKPRWAGSRAPRSTRIDPSGLDFSSAQAFIAPTSPSRPTKSICNASTPNRRFRSVDAIRCGSPGCAPARFRRPAPGARIAVGSPRDSGRLDYRMRTAPIQPKTRPIVDPSASSAGGFARLPPRPWPDRSPDRSRGSVTRRRLPRARNGVDDLRALPLIEVTSDRVADVRLEFVPIIGLGGDRSAERPGRGAVFEGFGHRSRPPANPLALPCQPRSGRQGTGHVVSCMLRGRCEKSPWSVPPGARRGQGNRSAEPCQQQPGVVASCPDRT